MLIVLIIFRLPDSTFRKTRTSSSVILSAVVSSTTFCVGNHSPKIRKTRTVSVRFSFVLFCFSFHALQNTTSCIFSLVTSHSDPIVPIGQMFWPEYQSNPVFRQLSHLTSIFPLQKRKRQRRPSADTSRATGSGRSAFGEKADCSRLPPSVGRKLVHFAHSRQVL